MPTFNDLYYTDLGNSNLKPESATQYDLGVVFNKQYNGHLLKNVQFQADGYYNTIQDNSISKGTTIPLDNAQFRTCSYYGD